MDASSSQNGCQLVFQPHVITLSQADFEEILTDLNDPEIRPAPPFAVKFVAEYAAVVWEDGTLDW